MGFLIQGICTVVETILRFLPIPCRTGLIKIGNPDKNAPVFLTGNYHLTVIRVRRALKGQNAFLLVANSRGVNVWCAAAGGHFSNHDVISALKTSGIENLVDHREVVLPQLAACGIEAKVVLQRTGWRVVWGPVYAKDIPAFLENRKEKSDRMRKVRFSLSHRLEMAVAWAFPMSVIFSLVVLLVRSQSVVPLIILVWALSFLLFSLFPLFLPLLQREAPKPKSDKFKFGQLIFLLILLLMGLSGLVIFSFLTSLFSLSFILFWGIIHTIAVFILGGDLPGSTPLLISAIREEKSYRVVLDHERCRGASFCKMVCPHNCFDLDEHSRKASFVREHKCIRCGACLVQCPFDALCFTDGKEKEISPDFIRKHKLNLIGKRDITG